MTELQARGFTVYKAAKSVEVIADPDKDEVCAFLHDIQVGGPWKLFAVNKDGHYWASMVTEFDVWQQVCMAVMPPAYGNAEIAEAWEILCELAEREMTKETAKWN